jgi:hypothetical protein
MIFGGKGCAQLMLCFPGPGVNTELLSAGLFTVETNGITVTHSLVVARTTKFIAAGEIFVMNCAYQSEDPASKLAALGTSLNLEYTQQYDFPSSPLSVSSMPSLDGGYEFSTMQTVNAAESSPTPIAQRPK